MTADDYREYLDSGSLLHVDHHDMLRSMPAGYPLAVTRAQMKMLLDYLHGLEERVGAEAGTD